MKRILLGLFAFSALTGFSQKGATQSLTPATNLHLINKASLPSSQTKTLLCVDTLRYPQAKEQILGTNNFYTGFGVWADDNEKVSHAFLNTASLTITGIEFYGAREATGASTVTVNAAIYNVNGSFQPTTLVSSGNVTISATTYGYRYVTLATPAVVTGNYAVVLTPTNTGGILNMLINDEAQGQSYDELFSTFYSDYSGYPNPSNWNTIPVFSPGYNYEFIVAPIVNYTINTQFNMSQTNICQGTQVNYTNTSTPLGHLSNRMTNYQVFRQYFGLATSDSTYVYDMDNASPYIWSANTSYTHPAAGSYDVLFATNGGFWNSCFDFQTQTLTVNPTPPTPTITVGGPTTFCAGGSVTLTSSDPTGSMWMPGGATTQTLTVTTSGSYSVHSMIGICVSANSAPVVVTVNPLDNATFTYPSATICSGSANQTPTVSTSGSFTSTPAGLVFANASTGEINVAGSTAGTYTVTYSTSGACPNTSNQTIVLTTAPDASFTYAQPSYCTNATNPNPVFGSGASAGLFSSTAGLNINSSTGVITLASSSAGTYTVTNNIAASGACPAASANTTVTILETPTATVSGGGQLCGTGTIPVTVTLTGSGPWDFTYTDGVTPQSLTGISTSPYTINASANGTYTVTAVSMNGCSAVGTGTATATFHANPTVTINAVPDLCSNGAPVSLVASPAGGIFSGSTGVSGTTFDPTGLNGTINLVYTYTDANSCTGTANVLFDVNTAPTVTLGTFTDVCSYTPSFALSGGSPAGGTYSGTGVTAGSFDPSAATVGLNPITYTFTDANGCSGQAVQSILVDDCAGLTELTQNGIIIYPNPASNVITIQTQNKVDFTMYAEDGKLVYSLNTIEGNTTAQVQVSHLAKGVYFMHFTQENQTMVQKVVVQ